MNAPPPPPPTAPRGVIWAPLALVAFFCLLFVPVMLRGGGGTSEEYDERNYHLPIIDRFAADWPHVNLLAYESATAPGFHLLMAGVQRAGGPRWAQRALNALIGVGLVLSVYLALRHVAPPWGAAALTLPLACPPYTLGATIWLTTDNASLLFVVLALGGAILGRYSAGKNLRLGIYAALATSVRQIHVWLAAPVVLVGLLATALPQRVMARVPRWIREDPWLDRGCCGSPINLAAGVLAGLMPLALLGWFVMLWEGLMPQSSGFVQLHNMGPNPAAPAFALALTAAVGIFFLPCAWRQVRALLARPLDRAAIAAAGVGLALALAAPTSFNWKPRANGWLWRIIEKVPAVMDRSLLITILAPAGALVLLLLHRGACERGRRLPSMILLLSLMGWLAAQTMNSMAWQRYFEPITLVGLAMLAAMCAAPAASSSAEHREPHAAQPSAGHDPRRPSRLGLAAAWGGPVVLAACYLGLNAITLYREVAQDLRSRTASAQTPGGTTPSK